MLDEFYRINSLINSYHFDILNEYHLTYMQWLLLKEIYLYDDFNLTAKKLEDITGQNKRLISINLKKLEEFGYINRQEIEGDKRNKEIIIEEFMLDVCETLINLDSELEVQLFSNLSDSEKFTLEDLLKKIK